MSTANLESKRFDGVRVNTKLLIDESNNSDDNADSQTPGSGLFIKPSTVTGRTANVTGFLLASSNESGKVEFTADITPESVTIEKGTVTQITSINTGVTVNAAAGVITTFLADTLADNTDVFTVTNSSVTATSVVLTNIQDYAGTTGLPNVVVDNVAAGSFDIVIQNAGVAASVLDGVLQIGFAVL